MSSDSANDSITYNEVKTSVFIVGVASRNQGVNQSPHLEKGIVNGLFRTIGVRAGRARGAAAPPKFGQLRFFGQHEKIWAKPVFKDVSMFLVLF